MYDLVADVGGTNTRLALVIDGMVQTGSIRRHLNADYPSLGPIIIEYMAQQGVTQVDAVCVCGAGPVHDGEISLTNLTWKITGADLRRTANARHAVVLNDLVAQAHAVGSLPADARQVVIRALTKGSRHLVIGLGTGVNAAVVHREPFGPLVYPSESGHVCLPTPTPDLVGLREYVERTHGFASVEEAISGRGVSACYAYVAGRHLEPEQVMRALQANEPDATKAVDIYVQALAAFASDLALVHLPFGGISLIGGVARRMVPWINEFGFAGHFRNKGRFSEFLEDFHVDVITDDYAALSGCAVYLADRKKNAVLSSEN